MVVMTSPVFVSQNNTTNISKIPSVNPNSDFSRKQLNHNNGVEVGNSFKISDDSSSFDVSQLHYVNYDISSYSKSEIRSLKSNLMLELEKVRLRSSRISSKKRYVANQKVMKKCLEVLIKLMKQKLGFVFNKPVDVVGMGLHDYNQIIKRPMDLGTIKKNLKEGYYVNLEEFASDVRLTFNNALLYNPKGHEVNTLAEKFLAKFDKLLDPVWKEYVSEKMYQEMHQRVEIYGDDDVFDVDQGVFLSKNQSPESELIEIEIPSKIPEPRVSEQVEVQEMNQIHGDSDVVNEVKGSFRSKNRSPEPELIEIEIPSKIPRPRVLEQVEVQVMHQIHGDIDVVNEVKGNTCSKKCSPEPQSIEIPSKKPEPKVLEVERIPLSRVVNQVEEARKRKESVKLPKPKAKDPNKREMSVEEKKKLVDGLESLPQEKMSRVIHIIRKRNGQLIENGGEIELDIEALDIETQWELDRFVTYCEKMLRKLRRQASMTINNVDHSDDLNQVDMNERMKETTKMVKSGGEDIGDEDVDIGDEMPVDNHPPVEIDKDDDSNQGGSRGGGGEDSDSSDSESSDSDTSSDSNSRSSSDSDSDIDDV